MTYEDKKTVSLLVEQLLLYGIQKGLLKPVDIFAVRNNICDVLGIIPQNSTIYGTLQPQETDNIPETANVYMDRILDYCFGRGLLKSDTDAERDLMSAKIMGLMMPRESEVESNFYSLYVISPIEATDYFYDLSRNCDYIQVERIKKDKHWLHNTEYGTLEITINLSKPEKSPDDIAAAKNPPQAGYPKCLLCVENVGFSGHSNHPARQNLRVIPMKMNGEAWYFQYSPYQYYNEHCIVLSHEHRPMKINRATFAALLDFLDIIPHYFIGSNADLPIVGGSILSHDHFQGGQHVFPMEKAIAYQRFRYEKYPDISISLVKWPLSVIRISGKNRESLVELSVHILQTWKHYSDIDAAILACTNENCHNTPHNTITPIARRNKAGEYELDLVLRNNRTTDEYPLGIFHPHTELHHIKKENIGLIEVMGLAVLPGRLASELETVADYLSGGINQPDLIHLNWADYLLQKYGRLNNKVNAEGIVKKEVGEVFKQVLLDVGVFKDTTQGRKQFHRFMEQTGFVKLE